MRLVRIEGEEAIVQVTDDQGYEHLERMSTASLAGCLLAFPEAPGEDIVAELEELECPPREPHRHHHHSHGGDYPCFCSTPE
jgi:hypothetical protein